MALPKPSSKPEWMPGAGAPEVQEPSSGKKITGWLIDERPPREYFNWLFQNLSEWVDYLESLTDETVGFSAIFKYRVGTGSFATHATLNAAIADAAAGDGILVLSDATINTIQSISKNNLLIQFLPGVTYSKGSATSALQIQASGCRIKGGRFFGFNGGSDHAILIDVGSNFSFISECRFSGNTNDVTDNNGNSTIFGNINE